MSTANDVSPVRPTTTGQQDYNTLSFVISQALSKVRTTVVVKVKACTNSGGLSPVGFVDLEVLSSRVDGAANVMEAGTIYDVPYLRIQGGKNAVIIDPEPGDIGLASIADRDISTIKASRKASAPGSTRKHNMADAIYHGGILNGMPEQYIQFVGGQINIVSPTKVTIKAPDIELDGAVTTTSTLDVADLIRTPVDVIGGGVSLKTHTTSEVQPGSGTSGPPNPSA